MLQFYSRTFCYLEPLPSIVGEPLGPTYVDSILEKYLFPLFDEPLPSFVEEPLGPTYVDSILEIFEVFVPS